MPRLNDDSMEQFNNIGAYGFSATRIENLGSSEYTLVNLVVDCSGSIHGFQSEMELTIKEIIKACQLSPRADNLMIRLVKFHDNMEEVHGFKLLSNCNLDDYNGVIKGGGMTLLYDSVINAMDATTNYAKSLASNDFQCNAITFVITDGADNMSKFGEQGVKESLEKAITSEALESLISILIGVNVQDNMISGFLQNLHKNAGFTQYVELKDAGAKTLSKLAQFVSKSISNQSQALGSGGASKSLSF